MVGTDGHGRGFEPNTAKPAPPRENDERRASSRVLAGLRYWVRIPAGSQILARPQVKKLRAHPRGFFSFEGSAFVVGQALPKSHRSLEFVTRSVARHSSAPFLARF